MQKKKLKYIILGTVAAIALGLIILAISMILEFCSTGEGKGEVVEIASAGQHQEGGGEQDGNGGPAGEQRRGCLN